jgi:hypothetical protein
MARHPRTVTLFVVFAITSLAADWKTPDGKISLMTPDETRYTLLGQLPPGMLALWQSHDQTMHMTVGEMGNPRDFKLERTGLEQGFLKQLSSQFKNGKLIASVVEKRGGHEIFTMSAQGESEGSTVFATQSITSLDGKAYTALVMGIGKDTRSDPDAVRFIHSFRVLTSSSPAVVSPAQQTHQSEPEKQGDSTARISQLMGTIAGILLFVAGAVWIARRLTRKPEKVRRRRRRPERDLEDDEVQEDS